MKPTISIIIPVYNGERYLSQCLESIIGQTLKNIEIIIVNDGSTDRTADICNQYAEKEERIRVINKNNSGPSETRNIGIAQASADVIGFVDADDWVAENMFETLYQTMREKQSDAVICNYTKVYKNTRKTRQFSLAEGDYSKEEILQHVLNSTIQSFLCNKLFHKKDISEPMPKGMYYEDNAILFKWFNNTSKVTVVHQPLYFYRQRKSSIMNDRDNAEKCFDFYLSEKHKIDFAKEFGYDNIKQEQLVFFALRAAKLIARGSSPARVKRHYIDLIIQDLRTQNLKKETHIDTKTKWRKLLYDIHPNLFVCYESICYKTIKLLTFKQKQLFD